MNFQELSRVRPDLAFIAHWVRPNAHVLDVGCGDGAMLSYLQTDKACTGYGIEIADDKLLESAQRGINVIQQDMEMGLGIFGDNSFDTVLCLSSLQMMQHVEPLLRDIVRVGAEAIVSFPNFAYWPHRVALARGRMPVSKSLPYQWYDTPQRALRDDLRFRRTGRRMRPRGARAGCAGGRPAGFVPAQFARQPGGLPAA